MELCCRRRHDTISTIVQHYLVLFVLIMVSSIATINTISLPCKPIANHTNKYDALTPIDRKLAVYVDELFSTDRYHVMPGVEIERVNLTSKADKKRIDDFDNGKYCTDSADGRNVASLEEYFYRRWDEYQNEHAVAVNIPETARFFKSKKAIATGKSSFLAGFGMGFLAFALKKLMLPLFIGAQLVKSVLIAMFLPSILGSLGKIVGKGLSTFSGVSGSSAGLNGAGAGGAGGAGHMEEFEFKDEGVYNEGEGYNAAESSLTLNTVTSSTERPNGVKEAMNRFGNTGHHHQRISYTMNHPPTHNSIHSDNYYFNRQHTKKNDFRVFHKIPTSSLLLTSYDPFYSPLLSRLDSVFQQLGLGNAKSAETERCRERLICMMYANPAKYAPYSNLVSAQLSRELNELRKPSSDNPEILRFFRYMRAAKDGQDGEECLQHGGCPSLNAKPPGPAMITTYNDINKLVLARKLN